MASDLNFAARPGGDGMPMGNELTLHIQEKQVDVPDSVAKKVMFDDDAAATIVWMNYQKAMSWIDQNSWLMEWQYVDYLYQSPNYDRDWRVQTAKPARISRFNVAKNRNTMSNQVRRAIFAEQNPFVLEPRGKLAGNPKAQTYIDAWTELFSVLLDRADFEYQMRLFIECQCLQGTAIGIPVWEERKVIRTRRQRKTPPVAVDLPTGTKKVNTWESDKFKAVPEEFTESWPSFEYRRLGTTLYDEKWRTPNRPDLSAGYRIDIDYVTFDDLRQMRELECYKDIPDDEELKKYFLEHPQGDAPVGTETAQNMNVNSSVVMHAAGSNRQTSQNPFDRPLMRLSLWNCSNVMEVLCYESRRKIIRNEEHCIGDHALGYTANWYNIDNSGYGFGIGRLNAGDQRMSQGVLNEVLKLIAYPLNAPILYDRSAGNAPTQNTITGIGQFLAVDTGPSHDIRKALAFMEPPQIPAEAWRIYQLAMQGGEDLVGANSTTMQGNLGGPGSSAMRTAAGVNRVGGKADENISDPVDQISTVIERFIQFLWKMVLEVMPIAEIREILSAKFGEAILEQIDSEEFLGAKFNIRILAGAKLAAKAAISQLIPFLLQIVQQPQLMQFNHEKGMTINFAAIEDLFMQMSELQGRQDIFIPLSPQEKQAMQQQNPVAMKGQADAQLEQLKQSGKVKEIQAKGAQDIQNTLVDKAMEHVVGDVPLELAESRLARNTDLQELQQGVPGLE